MNPQTDDAIRRMLVEHASDPAQITSRALTRARVIVPAGILSVGLAAGIVALGMYVTPGASEGDGISAATPAATTSARIDWSAPGSLTIGFTGVGPLTLGESSGDLVAEQGLVPTNRLSCATEYASDVATPVRVAIGDTDGIVSYVDVSSTEGPQSDPAVSPRTAEGIGLQSTETELLTAYPDATRLFDMQTMSGAPTVEYLIGSGQGAHLHAVVSNGLVTEIRANTSPDSFLKNASTC